MARLTKLDIEQSLLKGELLTWHNSSGKKCPLILLAASERRLFSFLLGSKVRESKDLSQDFINDLSAAYGRPDDPASTIGTTTAVVSSLGPWCLQSIETEGFGGLNIWGGEPFVFEFDQKSLLLEGPNGSGKSSLVGAILWALSGERPRDQADNHPHEPMPVFAANDKPIGDWPPIACYPPSPTDLKLQPYVRVKLTFKNSQDTAAVVERVLDGGNVSATTDPSLDIPSILLETGLLMPARLAHIRLDKGRGKLTDAVQKLTGLDDLVAISGLVNGLCHGGREYLSYNKKELKTFQKEFDRSVEEARDILTKVNVDVTNFKHVDTEEDKGDMTKFCEMLSEKATELTNVVSTDLNSNLDLTNSSIQHQVISAIGAVKNDLEAGFGELQSWKELQSIAQTLDGELSSSLLAAIVMAKSKAQNVVSLFEKSVGDSKFQLKAVAAQWHDQNESGKVKNCPLCEHDLEHAPTLVVELEALRSAGDVAARTFDDNLNAISAELDLAIPTVIKHFGSEVLSLEPNAALISSIRVAFVAKDHYTKFLVKFGLLVETALTSAPNNELVSMPVLDDNSVLKSLNEKIIVIERLLELAKWFHTHSGQWSSWWQDLSMSEAAQKTDGEVNVEKYVFTFNPYAYAPNRDFANEYGPYDFRHHYYSRIGCFDSKEEFECAVWLDQQADKGRIEFWVRNLVRREGSSFSLQKSDGKFYPDFICQLKDGTILIVEYKGGDKWDVPKVKMDRLVGELWANMSGERCRFVMAKDKNWGVIDSLL